MTATEIKRIIDETLKVDSVITTTPQANEVWAATNRWIIEPTEINSIISKGVKVYRLFADGGSINLAIEDVELKNT